MLASVVAAVAGSSSTAGATTNCSPPRYPGSGYFNYVKVTGTSCVSGKRLVLAYYRCRTAHGKKGRCTRDRVLGYRCTERRNSIPTEFVGKVTCRSGSKTVIHAYQQNT